MIEITGHRYAVFSSLVLLTCTAAGLVFRQVQSNPAMQSRLEAAFARSFSQETAQSALVEMLRSSEPEDKVLPTPTDWLLKDLEEKGAASADLTLLGKGSFDISKDGWTVDLAARRFQFHSGLIGFVGEFTFQHGKWHAKATGRIAICI